MADLQKEIWVDNEVKIGESRPHRRKATPVEAWKIINQQMLDVRAKNDWEESEEEEALTEQLSEMWLQLPESEQDELRQWFKEGVELGKLKVWKD